ncbi:MAG: glycosyltransferase N-terminal domain-containing protein [Hyphomicrobiaceae bacterium]
MARDVLHRLGILGFAGRNIARLVKLVRRSSPLITDPPDLTERLASQHPGILAFWHGQFMMVWVLNPKGLPVHAMVARHGDAELIGQALSALGVTLIRGAGAGRRKKDRGGAQALRASLKALGDGATIAMTADVPPGPSRRAGEGIITLARMSGRPIMPVALATSRFLALDTWSRMTINLPFARMAAVGADPIYVARDADAATLEAARLKLETTLNDQTRRAYEMVGSDYMRATAPAALPIDAPPPRRGAVLSLYRGATRLIEPAVPAWLRYRQRRGKEDPRRTRERYGIASSARPLGTLVWMHAASVGETNAVLPLMRALAERRPELSFLLTTGTVTSAELAERRLPARALHQFVPLDSPKFTRRFLDHWQPDLAIFTESEIWPNLVLELSERGTALAVVNARMSQRSFRRWRKARRTARALLGRFRLVLAQNDLIAKWFTQLGARDVRPTGNLKIDSPPPPVDAVELQRLQTAISGRPVLLAASTHIGEDEIVLEAHRLLARDLPGFLTIIAPRHPERGSDIRALADRAGLTTSQRSLGDLPGSGTSIYVADTIGELGTLYALTDIAFIGGSLVPHGGQNPIEAVRHGAAVVTGPHTRNFADQIRALTSHGGATIVTDAATLATEVSRLLGDGAALAAHKRGAGEALDGLSGALDRSVEALLELLPAPAEELRRAS